MDWSVFWGQLATSGVIVGGLVFLAKSLFSHLVGRDLERFKAELQRESLKHEVQVKRVDEKVADALSELYGGLQQTYTALRRFVNPAGGTDEKNEAYSAFIDRITKIADTLANKRLYIPPAVFEQADQVHDKMNQAGIRFECARRRDALGKQLDGDEHIWSESQEEIKTTIDPLFKAIVAEFQNRIGVVD